MFESLLDTKFFILNSPGLGPSRGRSSIAFILADDKSESDRLVAKIQGYHNWQVFQSKVDRFNS